MIAAAFATWLFFSIGDLLYHEDPIANADVIFVLGGNWLERVAEAGDLYHDKRAPLVLVSRELPDEGERALTARGLKVPRVIDVQVQALEAMGVPRNAIEIIEPQQATTTEAAAFRALAEQRHWRRAIVVTSRYHTARARMALMRRVSDLGVQIIMRPTRYDSWAPDHWWSPRASFRLTLVEAEKMLLYALRLAD